MAHSRRWDDARSYLLQQGVCFYFLPKDPRLPLPCPDGVIYESISNLPRLLTTAGTSPSCHRQDQTLKYYQEPTCLWHFAVCYTKQAPGGPPERHSTHRRVTNPEAPSRCIEQTRRLNMPRKHNNMNCFLTFSLTTTYLPHAPLWQNDLLCFVDNGTRKWIYCKRNIWHRAGPLPVSHFHSAIRGRMPWLGLESAGLHV